MTDKAIFVYVHDPQRWTGRGPIWLPCA